MWTNTLPLGQIKAWRSLFSLKISRLIEQLIIKKRGLKAKRGYFQPKWGGQFGAEWSVSLIAEWRGQFWRNSQIILERKKRLERHKGGAIYSEMKGSIWSEMQLQFNCGMQGSVLSKLPQAAFGYILYGQGSLFPYCVPVPMYQQGYQKRKAWELRSVLDFRCLDFLKADNSLKLNCACF